MTPATRLDVDVEVLHDDGAWYAGVLHHWRKRDDRWEAWVRYSVGVGMQYLLWVDGEHVRQA